MFDWANQTLPRLRWHLISTKVDSDAVIIYLNNKLNITTNSNMIIIKKYLSILLIIITLFLDLLPNPEIG